MMNWAKTAAIPIAVASLIGLGTTISTTYAKSSDVKELDTRIRRIENVVIAIDARLANEKKVCDYERASR